MALCNPGQWIACWPIKNVFEKFHTTTTAETMIHGSHPCQRGTVDVRVAAMAAASLMVNLGSGAGFQ